MAKLMIFLKFSEIHRFVLLVSTKISVVLCCWKTSPHSLYSGFLYLKLEGGEYSGIHVLYVQKLYKSLGMLQHLVHLI